MLQSRIGLKVKTLAFSITLFFLLGHIFVSIITHDIPGVQAKLDFDHDLNSMAGLGLDIEEGSPSEIGMENGKRFKLYEKKKLTHEKAKKFCKKREGQLALAKNVDEMRRLQTLLMKARMVGGDIWVGADKKEWKKYASKMIRRMNQPDLGPHAMMLGGGPTEMCPALSSGTRSLTPAACYKELPFICEYEPGKGKVKVKGKEKAAQTQTGKKESQTRSKSANRIKIPKRDEMKRRKREIVKLSEEETGSRIASTAASGLMRRTSTSTSIPSSFEPATTMTLDEIETLTSTTASEAEMTSPSNENANSPENEAISSTSMSTSSTDGNSAVGNGHYIGFIPHIVHSQKKDNDGKLDKGGITSMKLSTKLMLAEEPGIENLDNSNSIISSSSSPIPNGNLNENEPTLLANTVQFTSESDPDQAMVDLINEQSELQSLESFLIDIGMNLSVQNASASASTTNAIDTKSFVYDDFMSTLSTLEARSNDADTNETEITAAGKNASAKANSSKMKPDKRAGKGLAAPGNAASYLAGNSPLQKHFEASTVESSSVENSDTVTEDLSTSHAEFHQETLAMNASLSLLEPTITIELSSREGRDNMRVSHNGSSGHPGVMATPGPLLSPVNNSASKRSESQPSEMTTGHRSLSSTASPRKPETTTTVGQVTKLETTTQKVLGTTELKATTKSNIMERSPETSATATSPSRPISTKPQTQETQETTGANTPSTPLSTTTTPYLEDRKVPSASESSEVVKIGTMKPDGFRPSTSTEGGRMPMTTQSVDARMESTTAGSKA